MDAAMPNSASGSALTLRQVQQQDGAQLHDLIAACPPLDLNSRYAYLLHCLHHQPTSVVAQVAGKLVGAITAYIPPQQRDTLFVWQVAVAEQQRGQGLGKTMLEHLLRHCIIPQKLRWMETTISPSNGASQRLFTSFSRQNDAKCSVATLFSATDFGVSGHEEEKLYRIGPWTDAT
jgi:L-2,4-diaminobutyric acid acetyltransferase